jgi:hypothetical protein
MQQSLYMQGVHSTDTLTVSIVVLPNYGLLIFIFRLQQTRWLWPCAWSRSADVESPEVSDHYKDAAAYIAIAKTCHEAMQDSALDWQE